MNINSTANSKGTQMFMCKGQFQRILMYNFKLLSVNIMFIGCKMHYPQIDYGSRVYLKIFYSSENGLIPRSAVKQCYEKE